jgi:hypothetical protein
MLKKQKCVWYLFALTLKHQFPLTLPGIAIRQRPLAQ